MDLERFLFYTLWEEQNNDTVHKVLMSLNKRLFMAAHSLISFLKSSLWLFYIFFKDDVKDVRGCGFKDSCKEVEEQIKDKSFYVFLVAYLNEERDIDPEEMAESEGSVPFFYFRFSTAFLTQKIFLFKIILLLTTNIKTSYIKVKI